MSAAYARKSILARIDRTITDDSPKESDGKFLQEACIISDYNSAEFTYIKTRMENKYGFKFKNYHKRLDAVEQWEKGRDPLSVKKSDTKKPKLTTIKDNDWMKSYKGELSPSQALERFHKLKAEEKKQRLLEEARNVNLLW
ncbi:hypothetical protein [Candidatus Bandiella numerosa]|uniref:hypothetical protein n=1 Tax=Candidatus Bandiella numerosa TaxID=2570586 RepID=UPI001F354173|nr:hypothetical protein [Candidatus Bandiella numerosa]